MTELPFNTDQTAPEYVRTARKLHQMLANMKIDDCLMPERALCVELGISRVTLRRSLEYFHKQGFLEVRPGRGTWLARAVPPFPVSTAASHRLLGLVIPSVQEPVIARIVHGAEQRAADAGYHLALAQDHYDSDYQIQQLQRMAESNVSGLVVWPDANNLQDTRFMAILRLINSRQLPLVMIDRYAPEIAATSVLGDNFAGSYMATQHLILNGRRRLGLLAFGQEGGVSHRDRRRGFLTALKDYGLGPDPVFEVQLGLASFEGIAEQLIRQRLQENGGLPGVDGLVCMQDNMAFGAYLALTKAGIRVPDDVALVGYDNLDRELFQAAGLRLTSIDQSPEEIGSEAARLLITKIEGRDDAICTKHLLLKPKLVVRDSCGGSLTSSDVSLMAKE